MARGTITWMAWGALAVGALACNALFGDASQCSTDADCARFGGGYVCGAEGTCVARSDPAALRDAAPAPSPPGPTADGGGEASAPGPLATIYVSPSNASVPVGQTKAFTAFGTDSAGHTVSPPPTFGWTVSSGGTIDGSGLFRAGNAAGGPFTVTATSGAVSGTATISVGTTTTSIMIGETNILNVDDSGNANLLLAQEATLARAATIRSLSFYVAMAAGQLRLGIYDASGPNGGPGAKRAETDEMTAVAGWNAANVTAPVSLPAGNYWLAYAPSDNDLHFERAGDGTGTIAYYDFPYGALPATFSTTPTTMAEHWSFYATLTVP